jgi:hypothetical protein
VEQNKNCESPFDSSAGEALPPAQRPAMLTAHMPELVDPLVPLHPETAFTETRALRHDGWTPERKRRFLERLAECGIVLEASLAAGMSARAAYNLRDRDPLFAAGWEAACVIARPRLADEAWSRSMNGVVERIYRNGVIVAEKHRYDNRLTMAVLARLDSRIDRAEEIGAPPPRFGRALGRISRRPRRGPARGRPRHARAARAAAARAGGRPAQNRGRP